MENSTVAPRRSSWLAAFWIAQAVPLYTGAVLLACKERGLSAWAEKAVDPRVLAWGGGAILLVTALQAAFLVPFPRPAAGRGPGVSMEWRLAGVGFLVAVLVAGAVATIIDGATAVGGEMGPSDHRWAAVVGVFVAAWIVATPLLIRFSRRGDPESFLSRLASRLLLGTAMDVVASIPIAVFVERRSRCYCSEVSIFALVILIALGFLVMGPAVLIPVFLKRRRDRHSAPS